MTKISPTRQARRHRSRPHGVAQSANRLTCVTGRGSALRVGWDGDRDVHDRAVECHRELTGREREQDDPRCCRTFGSTSPCRHGGKRWPRTWARLWRVSRARSAYALVMAMFMIPGSKVGAPLGRKRAFSPSESPPSSCARCAGSTSAASPHTPCPYLDADPVGVAARRPHPRTADHRPRRGLPQGHRPHASAGHHAGTLCTRAAQHDGHGLHRVRRRRGADTDPHARPGGRRAPPPATDHRAMPVRCSPVRASASRAATSTPPQASGREWLLGTVALNGGGGP